MEGNRKLLLLWKHKTHTITGDKQCFLSSDGLFPSAVDEVSPLPKKISTVTLVREFIAQLLNHATFWALDEIVTMILVAEKVPEPESWISSSAEALDSLKVDERFNSDQMANFLKGFLLV